MESNESPLVQNLDGNTAISALLDPQIDGETRDEIFYLATDSVKKLFPNNSLELPREKNGSNILHKWIESDQLEWVKLWIPLVALQSWELLDEEGYSPFHYIIKYGLVELAELVLKNYPNLFHFKNSNQQKSVHIASESNQKEILLLLLDLLPEDFNTAVQSLDTNKNSVLHLAVESDAVEILPFLLEQGIDLRIANIEGHTIFNIAEQNKYHHSLKILKRFLISSIQRIQKGETLSCLPISYSDSISWVKGKKILKPEELIQITPDIL